jgi:dTDP-4-dehydrorhamnose reductase
LKIAVIGANGQLGSDVCNCFLKNDDEVIKLNHDDIEIVNIDSVASILKQVNADIVVNTAAMHNVEKCEENPVRSFEVNGIGSRNLALICNEIKSKLVHISTDYVFDGEKKQPYIESDRPNPLNVYGNTKLSGEHFIESIGNQFYILRVSAIYGKNPCRAKGNNFVNLMLRLSDERDEVRVVDTEYVSPTFTENIGEQIIKLIETNAEFGLYHVAAEGSCSWYEFAKEIFLISKTETVLKIASPSEFSAKVKRPKYSVMENKKLNGHNINIMLHWRDGLKAYLK